MLMSRLFTSVLSHAENAACRSGVLPTLTWNRFLAFERRCLYAGDLRPNLPQYSGYVGLTPFRMSLRAIDHDVTKAMPIPDESIDRYQAEDVFEHIEYPLLPGIIEEVYRVLKQGGLFRLSVPDYGFDVYRARTVMSEQGELAYDPAGGGHLKDGKVIGGGHLWFPTLDSVRSAFSRTSFSRLGEINYLHGYEADGRQRVETIDYSLGHIKRTPDHDPRGQNPYRPISVVVDAWKAKSRP